MYEGNRSTFLHDVTGNLENVEENLRKRSSENYEFHKIVYILLENIIFDNYHSEQSSHNTQFSLNKTKLFRSIPSKTKNKKSFVEVENSTNL